jgi:hypothetical protein
MRGQNEKVTATDVWLTVFAIVAGWLVIFQSGLVK